MAFYASPFDPYRQGQITPGISSMDYLEANPDTAYDIWGRYFGADPTRPGGQNFYRYSQSVMPSLQQGFYARGAQEQGLRFTDYLDQLSTGGRGLGDMWSGLAPSQRGERPGQFAPQVKWVS